MHAIRRACIVIALACALAGCGRDPVRDDLERYARVLGAIEQAERETAREVEPILERVTGGRFPAPEAQKVYAGALAPRYERLVNEALSPFKAATPELGEVHGRVLAHYTKVHGALRNAAGAFARLDWSAADDAHEVLARLTFEPLRREIAQLAEKHGMKLVPPSR
jgi:hypothetical protein